MAPGMIACGSASQASRLASSQTKSFRETGRVVEAVHLAGRLADDLEQRRTLPNWLEWICGVAGRALLLEQRRTIGRLGSGQRHLRAGDLRNQQRPAKSQPETMSCAASSYASPSACADCRSREIGGGSSGLFHGRTKVVALPPDRSHSSDRRCRGSTRRICGRSVAKHSQNDPEIPARSPHRAGCMANAPFAPRVIRR